MESFPVFINIKDKPITVIGGGDIALRKVKLLIKAKPKITLISKTICKDLKELFLKLVKEKPANGFIAETNRKKGNVSESMSTIGG